MGERRNKTGESKNHWSGSSIANDSSAEWECLVTEPEVLEVLTIMGISIPIICLLFIFSHHISAKGRNKTMKTFHIKWSVTPSLILKTGTLKFNSVFLFMPGAYSIIFVLAMVAHKTQCALKNLHWKCITHAAFLCCSELFQAKYLRTIWILNGFTQFLSSLLSQRQPLAQMCLFSFLWGEDRNVLFTVFTLLLSKKMERLQRERATAHSLRIGCFWIRWSWSHFYQRKVCCELKVYFIHADGILD